MSIEQTSSMSATDVVQINGINYSGDSEIRQGYAAINEAIRRLEVTSTSSKKETTVPIDKSPGI